MRCAAGENNNGSNSRSSNNNPKSRKEGRVQGLGGLERGLLSKKGGKGGKGAKEGGATVASEQFLKQTNK